MGWIVDVVGLVVGKDWRFEELGIADTALVRRISNLLMQIRSPDVYLGGQSL